MAIERSVDLSLIGADGGAYVTDLGVSGLAVPTGYDSVLPGSFHPLGAISEDGLTYGFDEDKQDFFAWGQLSAFRSQVTKSLRTFQITLWEPNRAISKSVMFRKALADVTPDGDGEYAFAETAAPTPDRRAWVFDVLDGSTMERFYVPSGEVSDRDDVSYKNDDMSGYNITVTAYADAAGNTVYHLGKVVLSGS